jgi:glycosyltransferase 2 family protein
MAETPETLETPRPKAIYWIISLALAGVFLYYSLRGIEWGSVWLTLKSARIPVVAGAVGIMSLALFLRSFRWRVLLSAQKEVSIPLAFWATSAGYLGNNVLPARAGEVVRTLMISRRSNMSRAFVLTTALSERVVDAIALVTISAVVLLTLPTQPGWLAKAAKPFAILGLSGAAAIALLPAFEAFWFRFLARIPLPEKLRHPIEHILEQVLEGIRSFHDGGRLTRFLMLTAVIWMMDGVTTVIASSSIGVPITLPMAFLLVAGLGLGSALPSTPGYVGIYQLVAVTVLTPFGISKSDSIAYILLFQAMNYLIVLIWGLLGIAAEREPKPQQLEELKPSKG